VVATLVKEHRIAERATAAEERSFTPRPPRRRIIDT
jgi:hypothetical protein